MTTEALTIQTTDCQSFQTAPSQAQSNRSGGVGFGRLTARWAELMADREGLELQRRPAPEGSEKCGPKSGQEVPEGESKGEQQLPVYQSARSLREPQSDAAKLDESPCIGHDSVSDSQLPVTHPTVTKVKPR
jgi:hypothetical protein